MPNPIFISDKGKTFLTIYDRTGDLQGNADSYNLDVIEFEINDQFVFSEITFINPSSKEHKDIIDEWEMSDNMSYYYYLVDGSPRFVRIR